MHHRMTFMYIKFQQNWVNRSAKPVRTNICKLHEFATIPIVFFIKSITSLQTCTIIKRTCISLFSKMGFVDQSKPCTQIYMQKSQFA